MQQRKLQFVEGTSSKFWHATQDGASLTVTYGRIGTAGQTQEKTFGSDAEAEAAFAKQVTEKVKKGYSDDDGAAASPTPAPVAPKKAPVAAAPEPVTPPTPAADADPPVRLRLKPEEMLVPTATAPRKARLRPATRPFDHESCVARLLKVAVEGSHIQYLGSWNWSHSGINLSMSREEAHFWLSLATAAANNNFKSAAALEQWARALVCDGSLPLADALPTASTRFHYHYYPPQALNPIFVLYGVRGLVDFLVSFGDNWYVHTMVTNTENLILPFLTDDEAETLRESLLTLIQASPEPPIWAMRLSARLAGNPEVLRGVVARWADGSGRPQYFGGYGNDNGNVFLRVALGIGDPDTVAAEVRRLDAVPNGVDDIKALLAVTGFRVVDVIARGVLAHTTKADAEKLTNALALAEGPQTAPAMLEIALESKAPKPARDWLESFPAFAIDGLAPLLGTTGKKADAALELLRNLKKQGNAALLARKAEAWPLLREKVLDWEEVVHPALADDEAPDWVRQIFGGALSVPDAPADENPPHRLHLPESAYAAGKPAPLPPPRPLGAPAPFDRDDCLARLRTVGNPTEETWRWKWDRTRVGLPLSRAEAHFWNEALRRSEERGIGNLLQLEAVLQPLDFTGDVPLNKLCRPTRTGTYSVIALQVAWALHGIAGLLHSLEAGSHWPAGLVQIAADNVLPWLSDDERAETLRRVTDKVKAQKNPELWALLLGARLGMSVDVLREAVEKWPLPQNQYARHSELLPILAQLEDPDRIAALAYQLRVFPTNPDEARVLLAATDGAAVDTIALAVADGWGDGRDALARTLLSVEIPAVAPALLTLRRSASLKRVLREWLDRNPALTVEGLAPRAVLPAKEAEPAIEYLREMARRGWRWLIAAKLPGLSPEVAAAVQTKVLDYDPSKTRKPTPADAKLAALLPPVVVRTDAGLRRLADGQMAQLLALLRTTPITQPSPELALLRDNAERVALEAFVAKLFDSWLGDGGPSKDRWKFEALGHLGGDASALKLAPLVRAWPGESQHQRAVLGLDILRAIGTDTALMQLHGMAQKLSFKGLKQRAGECLEAIAADRGFTPDELADRIIPDGGLDERGGFTLDFGPRQFEFVLGPDLKPLVRDPDGQRRPDLPKPTQKDDPDKAAEAQAQWKLLKKQVADVAKTQATRLEQAMVLGRRWAPETFQTLFVAHPVMVHLVRRLIWAAYDDAGKPLTTFRVCDDNTLASSADDALALPEATAAVGVVHPSHLSDTERGAWGEVLSDYEIIAPFVQLGRTIHTLNDAERGARQIARFAGIQVDPKVLVFGLENLGWHRGTPQDGGSFASHHKAFGEIFAVVTYADGVWVGSNGDDWDDQKMESVGFIRDRSRAADGWFSDNEFDTNGIVLSELDPVVVSEVLYDITRIVEKGRKG